MRLKALLSSFVLLFFFVSLQAQQVDLSKSLPTDPSVVSGTLPNGMMYFIKQNKKPANRVFLRLVVKAGSVCEDDDQQGLAHFTEHMCFNGTKNFPKHKLIKFLESTGMKFGADLNAYTAFDQTVYMLEIPLDKPQYLDTALLILHDWAHYVSLEDQEIDDERGVIIEEWRLGRGAQDRMMRKIFPVLLYGSKYADRLPIGKVDIIKNFKYDVLKRFYHDWYRPDLEAVIVVGDIDPQQVKEKIVKLFSQIPASQNPRPRVYPEIPEHNDIKAVVATDKEAPYSIVAFYWKHPMEYVKTYGDFKKELTKQLAETMLSNRYKEKMLSPKTPYAIAMAMDQHLMDKTDAFVVLGIAKKGRISETAKTLMEQIESARRYGFGQSELERAKKQLLARLEKQYNERNKTESNYFVQLIQNHFDVEQAPLLSPEQQYKIAQQLLPSITQQDVNNAIKQLATDKNLVVVVQAPDKEKVPTDQELIDMVKQVRSSQVQPYKDVAVNKPLIAKKIRKGKIVKEEKDAVTGATIWTLKNGVKVVIKPTQFKDDEVLMQAFSKGGYSLYPVDELPSARIAADLISNAGVGDFTQADLQKFLADKNVSVSPFINLYHEGFEGQSDVKNFETMLQLIYQYFMSPRYDTEAYKAFVDQQRAILENKANDPQSVWVDTLMAVLGGNSPYTAPINTQMLDEVNFRRAYEIYKERFADPGSFTFVFVGNVDLQKARPLIEKYLGGLPKKDKKENYRDVKAYIPAGKVITKYVYKGTDPKSLVYMVYTGNWNYSLRNDLLLRGVSDIFTGRLLDTVREALALTYSISASPIIKIEPKQQYGIAIFYSANPDTLSYITKRIISIDNSLKQGISDREYKATIEKLLKAHETQMQQNRYWLTQLVKVYSYGLKPDFVTDYDKLVRSFTKDDFVQAAKQFVRDNSYLIIALKPETK